VSYSTDITLQDVRRPVVVFAALLLSAGVSLSPAQAQSTGAAKLIQMTGQVSYLRGSTSMALSVGDSIQPQQVIVTGPDGSAIFQVSDGSTFEVFPNSKAVFRESAGNWEDLLRMMIGRVRVEIQHLGGKPNPNKVRTATAVISVRGTIFDVTVEDDQGTTLVLVEEGKVAVRHLIQGGEAKLLNPGEWVEVFWNQPLASRKADHGAIIQHAVNMVKDTLYEALIHNRAGTGVGTAPGTTAGGTSTDKNGSGGTTGGTTSGGGPPPPPPPPAPPAH
jgi:ferric-dicitrate binding protein FerR (iron transport regulator)